MHGAPWSLKINTGPVNNRIKQLAQSERAWLKAAWSYTMMLLAHAGGHSEGNQTEMTWLFQVKSIRTGS